MVACEDGHGSDGGEKLSLTAPQKQETYQSEPGDQGEERMTPQSTEGKSVVHQETTFGKRIPDGDRPAAVVTPASEEKPADHRDLMDQGQGVAAEGAVAFAGDQRHMAADPIFCSPEIGADDASEGGRAEKKSPKGDTFIRILLDTINLFSIIETDEANVKHRRKGNHMGYVSETELLYWGWTGVMAGAVVLAVICLSVFLVTGRKLKKKWKRNTEDRSHKGIGTAVSLRGQGGIGDGFCDRREL